MKTLKLGLMIIFCLNTAIYAQIIPDTVIAADVVHVAYKNRMNEIFENVDLTQVPSGLLYDRGFPFIALEAFDGRITDSSAANSIAFGLCYATITNMIVDPAADLPSPSGYMQLMDSITPLADVIPIIGMHQIYHKFDDASLEDSLLVMLDSNLFDVLGRVRSPYVQKELFLFAPVEITMNNPTFSFYFDSNHFYNNTGKTILSLKIDVGNGQGYQTVSFDQNIPVIFNESGKHNFKIELMYTDSTVYYSHFDIIVRTSASREDVILPDIVHHVEALPAEYDFTEMELVTWGRGGGTINVFLACGRERIEKPFIWAEAYNPSVGAIQANLKPEDIIKRMKHPDGIYEDQNLLEYLQNNGYDIIVLDYDYGTDYLPRTAEFIKVAIRWVNLQKVASGSSAKNMILGQSMGGVCTTQALREMENDFEDHQVETFIIYDSPIRGVNIPLAAQASLLDMATVWVNKPFSDDDRFLCEFIDVLKDMVTLLYEPATRTMITEQVRDLKYHGGPTVDIPDGLEDLFGYNTEHLYDGYYNYLHGAMGGLPQDCEVIAMTNGSEKGSEGVHEFGPGMLLLKAEANNYVVGSIIAGLLDDFIGDPDLAIFESDIMAGGFGLLLWSIGINTNINIEFNAMNEDEDYQYYKHKSKLRVLLVIPVVSHHRNAFKTDGLEVDHAPGGFFGLGNQGIFFTPGSLASTALSEFRLNTWCFTPTGSVLNYYDPTTGETWRQNLQRSYSDPSADITLDLTKGLDSYLSNSTTPIFPANPGFAYQNTAHTWFTSEQTHYMVYNLIGADPLVLPSLSYGTIYNYGRSALTPTTDFEISKPIRTSSILDHSLIVNGTEYNVNSNDKIGLSPIVDPLGDAMANSHFIMHLGPICEPTPKVTLLLEEVAEMNIGDGATRTGSVLVQNGHQITVTSGSVLKIKTGSSLKLNRGGLLHIEDGGTVIIEGSLITEEGSELHYFEGASIVLSGENSQLVIGGFLHLHENADFKPTHPGVNSGVVVITNPEGALIAETGSKFRIIGDIDTDPMLVIQDMAKLIAPSELEEFYIGTCQVFVRSALDFPIQSFAKFTTSNAQYLVQSNLEEINIHPTIGLFNKSYISNCVFKDVLIHSEEMVPSDGYLLVINNTTFDLTYNKIVNHLRMANGNVSINNCTFADYTDQGVLLNGLTSYSKVSNSTFWSGNGGYSIYKVGENELSLKNNLFSGGKSGVYNSQGQISLRCNDFSNISQMAIYGGYNGRIEMSQNFKQGYNTFVEMDNYNVKLQHANFLSISNGYNYFWDESSYPIIEGTVTLDLPGALILPGARNQWNASNSAPTASDIEVFTFGTTDEIPYSISPTMSGTCGAYDPSHPPIVVVGSQGGIYLPQINLPGLGGMRLDSAYSEAVSNTVLWNPTKNDAQAIGYFHAILSKNYTQQELARPETRYFLDQAYAAMKYTLGHAVSDSTILRANNTTSFDATVQKYVDVLNLLTQEDTFALADYHKRFALELDKANLFRMLGHTESGLDILQNISLCPIDSSERAALNELMAIYENEAIKRAIGASAYGFDRLYVEVSNYTTPSNSQATEFNFGSVINNLSNVSYRTCNSGSLMPDAESNRATSFLLYPNPSEGVINLKYEIPSESNAELVVYSMNGQVIYRGSLVDGSNTETIDISRVESGLYFYTILYNGVFEHAGRISIAH